MKIFSIVILISFYILLLFTRYDAPPDVYESLFKDYVIFMLFVITVKVLELNKKK